MKRIKIFILMLVSLIGIFLSVVKAELVDGPANFRDKPNGKIIFSLNDNIDIQCEEEKNGWCYSGIYVYVKKDSFIKEPIHGYTGKEIIGKNVIFYNNNGKAIGKTLDLIKVQRDIKKQDNECYSCLIVGYTYQNNIKWETSIERDLEIIINNCDKAIIDYSYLENHMKKYGYWNDFQEMNGFNAYQHPDVNMNDESPEGRIILIFYQHNLAAILYKRQMIFNKFKLAKKMGSYNVIEINESLGDKFQNYLKFITTYSGQ